MKPKILFILHLPPPIHGAAMMGKYIQESELVNSSFDCFCINLATAGSLSDIGHISLKKLLKYFFLLKHISNVVREIRPELVYITPNAGGKAFFKDFIVVQMLKSMGCKVIAHYHNKGVSVYQSKWVYNFFYKRFFSNLKVILLAENLYKDMAKYVKREDVYICPNGIPSSCKEEMEARRNNVIPHLLFLSNLLISKGVIVLLDALRILKEKGYLFNCQYVGGETAEMPGFYGEGEYDMAGFSVGIVDKDKIITGAKVKAGNKIIGIASSGIHSNGYSLVRKVFNIDADPDVLFSTPAELGGKTLGEALLAPTKIYVKPVLKVLEEVQVKGISHITGGGFYENIPRSLKKGCCARIKKEDVRIPALFHLMQETGHISEHDMFNTFNMGVGMVLTVPAAQADKALEILHANGEPEAYKLGVIAEGDGVELC